MALLRCFHSHKFENPARRVFLEGGELFEGGSSQVKTVGDWVNEKGESTEAARKLAEQVNTQMEAIREGTRKDLVRLYVDVFDMAVPDKETLNATEFTVNASLSGKGLLEALSANSPVLKVAFKNNTNVQLLAYGNIYKEFKARGFDANYMPMGAQVKMENGLVTLSYKDKSGVQKTVSALLFPWDVYEAARRHYADMEAEDRAQRAREIEEQGGPQEEIDLGDDEEATPDVETPVELAPVEPEAAEPAPETSETWEQALEKDWQRVLTAVEQSRAADPKLANVTITEGPRNARGHDKTLIIKDAATGHKVQLRVDIREKKEPRSYTDKEALGLNVWNLGNGHSSREIQDQVDAYMKARAYQVESVEKTAYELALVLAGERLTPNAAALRPAVEAEAESEARKLGRKTRPTEYPAEAETREQMYARVQEFAQKYQLTPGSTAPRSQVEYGAGTYVASFTTPDGKPVEINVRVLGDESEPKKVLVDLDKALQEEIKDLSRRLDREARRAARKSEKPDDVEQPRIEETPEVSAADKAADAARALNIAVNLTPEDLAGGNEHFKRNTTVMINRWTLAYEGKDDKPAFVASSYANVEAPQADGSADWLVEFRTATGETLTVHAQTPAVDGAKVDAFIEAQAAIGKNFTREDVVKYLGYMQMLDAWPQAVESMKASAKLDKKYRDYLTAKPQAETKKPRIDEALDAGYTQDFDEMRKYAVRSIWKAVDAQYREAVAKERKGATPMLDVHELGAQAARALGNIDAYFTRSQRVLQLDPNNEEAKAALDYIRSSYGTVTLNLPRSYEGERGLEPLDAPFESDQRMAIETANRELKEKGSYSGYLPVGSYTLDGNSFNLSAGETAGFTFEAPKAEEPVKIEEAPKPVEEVREATEVSYPALTAEQIDAGYTGNGSWTWQEDGLESGYQGGWMEGVPMGNGYILTDDLGKLGPIDFDNGRAAFKKPDQDVDLLLEWIPDQKRFSVLEF